MHLTQQHLKPIKDSLSKLHSKNVALIYNSQVAEGLVNQVANNMQHDISEGNILIPTNQTAFHTHKKAQKPAANDSQVKLMEISEKKDQIYKQLQALSKQEQNLKLRKMSNSKLAVCHQYYRSEMTTEDIEKLKKLKQEQKKFERLLQQKTQQYEERIQRQKQQQQMQKQEKRREKYEQKKHQIQKTLQLIQKRKQEREQRYEEQKKTLKQLKNRKKLHEQWENKWKAIEEEEMRKKQELKEQLRKIKKITHEEIKEHQKKYNETMKNKRQLRVKEIATSRFSSFCSYRSVFLEQILEQEERKKESQQARKVIPKQFLHKIKQYSERVKVLHKPIMRGKEQQAKQEQKKEGQTRSISLFEMHEKGNLYMRSANAKVAQAFKKRDTNVQGVIKGGQKQVRYKNYLKEIKESEARGEKRSELEQIKQIMGRQKLTAEQKLSRAKLLAQKLEKRKVIHTSQGIVNSINAKIEILRQVDY